jgi:hypothetical protein
LAHLDIREGDASPMKEFIGVVLAVLDERRMDITIIVTTCICIAAVWAILLAWTQ